MTSQSSGRNGNLGRGTIISAFKIMEVRKVVDLPFEFRRGNASLQEFCAGDVEAELKSVIQGQDTLPPTHAQQEADTRHAKL